jgi:cephalosporin hydroxylase
MFKEEAAIAQPRQVYRSNVKLAEEISLNRLENPYPNSLDELGRKHGTDKASQHHDFLRLYEKRLSHLRTQRFTMFEVGVYHGASVATWSEYFSQAVIVGLDIDPQCKQYERSNIHIRIGDQSDAQFLFDTIIEFGKPRLIIDDGSHRWDHQITTFQILFPLLEPGGFYICEDIDTSFDAHLKQADFAGLSSISTFDYLVKLLRLVTGDAAVRDERPYDLFISSNYSKIESAEFARRTCIIRKRI